MKNIINKDVFIYYLPPFGYACLVFYLSSLPSWKLEKIKSFPDYLLHFTEYAVFAWLVLRFIYKLKENDFKFVQYSIVLGILTLFAVSDEWHQSFIPGRDASVYDFLADFAGLIAVTGIYIAYKKYYIKRQ